MRDWANFFTEDEIKKVWQDPITLANATKYLNAKIREALQAAPKVYGKSESVADYREAWNCSEIHSNGDTHIARLVDVKPIEKGEG
jgi:hypothetical protein